MTIVKGNIGNALHSVAPDHIVATADEIYDEALGQYQNEINQNAGAFDISQYNKNGDTPATYATLALALAAVPSAQRKGGMSVKYLQDVTALYSVIRTDNITTAPTGTALVSESEVTTGILQAGGLSDFSSLPQEVSETITYYYAVSTGNWTTWELTKKTDDSTQYVQYRLISPSWSTSADVWTLDTAYANISLICDSDFIPNVDTTNNTLDLGHDPIILCGGTSYVLFEIHDSDSIYRSIPLCGSHATGAWRLVFNRSSATIRPLKYSDGLKPDDVVFGGVRLTYNTHILQSINLPFAYRKDGYTDTDALSLEIKPMLTYQTFIGQGAAFVRGGKISLIPSHKYRFYTNMWETGTLSSNSYIFRIFSFKNSVETVLYGIAYGSGHTIPAYVDITTPADFDYIQIGGRATSGVTAAVQIIDMQMQYENIDILDLSNINKTDNVLAMYDSVQSAINAIPADLRKGRMGIKFLIREPAFYYIKRTDELTTAPTGTQIEGSDITTGDYDIADLDDFPSLPTTRTAKIYYAPVGNTYTKWEAYHLADEEIMCATYMLNSANYSSSAAKWQYMGEDEHINVISAAAGEQMPNINTEDNTLDMTQDPVIICGSKSYAIATNIGCAERYRKAPLTTSASSAAKIVFNKHTNIISAKNYNASLKPWCEVVIGSTRFSGNVLKPSFNFPHTIDNKPLKKGFNVAFNVSEYKNGKTYTSLKDALADVPTVYKYGGLILDFLCKPVTFYVKRTDNVTTQPTGTQITRDSTVVTGVWEDVSLGSTSPFLPFPAEAGDTKTCYYAQTVDGNTTYTVWVLTNISTEDTKYIRYRLKNDTWSNSVTNWEKITETGEFSLITDRTTVTPNIKTNNSIPTLDLGGDPTVLYGSGAYSLALIHGNSKNYLWRNIPLRTTQNTSAFILLYSTITNTFRCRPYNTSVCADEIVVGGIRYQSGGIGAAIKDINLPFEYTTNGKKPWDNIKASASQINSSSALKYISHRGLHLLSIPENSLDAYRFAGYCGFDYAETDFCPTSDGVLVLMHDESINRTMKNKSDYSAISETVNVIDKTYQQLVDGYVLASGDVRYRRQIPTLEEYFIECRRSGIFPLPEIKQSGTTQAHVLQAYNLGCQICGEGNFGFCSFSYSLLDYARSLSEITPLAYIGSSILDTTNTITNNSRNSKYTIWDPQHTAGGLTAELIKQYHAANMKVAVWTVPVAQFNEVMDKGVDIIATDYISASIAKMPATVARVGADWSDFTTTGTVTNKILSLSAGQTLTFTGTTVWLGGYYLSIIGKGSFTIAAPNLSTTITSAENDRFVFQGLIDNKTANLTITATAATQLEFVEFAAASFI